MRRGGIRPDFLAQRATRRAKPGRSPEAIMAPTILRSNRVLASPWSCVWTPPANSGSIRRFCRSAQPCCRYQRHSASRCPSVPSRAPLLPAAQRPSLLCLWGTTARSGPYALHNSRGSSCRQLGVDPQVSDRRCGARLPPSGFERWCLIPSAGRTPRRTWRQTPACPREPNRPGRAQKGRRPRRARAREGGI
jgi:hypothetical protein